MNKGLKMALAVGIPTIVFGSTITFLLIEKKKRDDLIVKLKASATSSVVNGVEMVTYRNPQGEKVTVPKKKVDWVKVANTGVKVFKLVKGLFGGGGSSAPTSDDEVLDYEPEFEMNV